MDKEALVKIIQESIPGINEQGIAAIMSNIRLETDDFKSLHEYAMDHDRIFEKKDGKYSNIFLKGPAIQVFKGTIECSI